VTDALERVSDRRSPSPLTLHPSKNPPHLQPVRVTAACCPLAVTKRPRIPPGHRGVPTGRRIEDSGRNPCSSLANTSSVPQRAANRVRSASSCLRTDEAPVPRQPRLTTDPHVVGSDVHRGATPHGTMATSKTAEAVDSGQAPRRSPIHHTGFALTRSLAEASDTRDAYGTHRPLSVSGKRTSHTASR
jgi:hypothetical protein